MKTFADCSLDVLSTEIGFSLFEERRQVVCDVLWEDVEVDCEGYIQRQKSDVNQKVGFRQHDREPIVIRAYIYTIVVQLSSDLPFLVLWDPRIASHVRWSDTAMNTSNDT
jgi:hypothetical protein